MVRTALYLYRRGVVRGRNGRKPPFGPHHPPPPPPGRHAPLHPPRGHVPLRLVGQLLRRTARMGGIRRSLVVVGRNGLRMVDLRQPRTARRIAAPPLRAGVRRRVFAPSPQTDHPLHLLTRLKGGVQVADGPLQRFSPSSAPAGLRRRLQGRRKNFTFRNEVCASDFQPSTSNSQLSIQCPLHFSPLIN